MSRRKSNGCLGLIFIGVILYSCVSSTLGLRPSTSISESNIRSITASQNSGPRVVLPPATRVTESASALVVLPTAAPTEETTQVEVESSGVWGVVTAATLNVRESPSTDTPILGTLSAGECVEIMTMGEGWYGVATKIAGGWSSSDYITVVTACPEPTAVLQMVASAPVAIEPTATTATQEVAATNTLPSYAGQPFAPNAAVARDGSLYECFGQGNNGLRAVGAGTPVQVLGVGDFSPSAEQQAMLGSGPFYKIRIWDGQFAWLPASVMDADPLAFAAVPGDCAEYDTIDWTTVVRPDPPTAVPTVAAPLPEWTRVVATPTSAPSWTPNTNPAPSQSCCKICTTGKACGNSCISRSYTCRVGPGCACNG